MGACAARLSKVPREPALENCSHSALLTMTPNGPFKSTGSNEVCPTFDSTWEDHR